MTELPSTFTRDTCGTRARSALGAMTRHKPDLPASWFNADALYGATTKIRHEQPPAFPGLPASASKARAAIDAHAKALGAHRDRQLAADAAGEYAQRSLSVELERLLPDWYGLLAEKFAAAAAEFTSIGIFALSGYESDDDMREYGRKKRAAFELHQLWYERVALASATNETSGAEQKLWVIAAPPPRPASLPRLNTPAPPQQAGQPPTTGADADREAYGESVKRWFDLERWWPEHYLNLPPFERYSALVAKGVPLTLAERGMIDARREAFEYLRQEFAGGVTMTMLGQEHYQRERLHLPVTVEPAPVAS